jgi:hypothetical protein
MKKLSLLLAIMLGMPALITVTGSTVAGAQAQDAAKYPEWFGQWSRTDSGPNRYDQTKPGGLGQKAPLTAEYQAIFDANMADQETGGQGTNITHSCLPGGLVRDMSAVHSLEFVVTPKITYVLFGDSMPRRIYTDGRDWPRDAETAFAGYSIGRWNEPDQEGRYSVLEVETRNFSGPRVFDNIGIPFHVDNQTIVRERFYRDTSNPKIMHNDMTTIDHALTRPWAVNKTYRLEDDAIWLDENCTVGNQHIQIGRETYFLSADNYLMPAKKGQQPPDMRYFKSR